MPNTTLLRTMHIYIIKNIANKNTHKLTNKTKKHTTNQPFSIFMALFTYLQDRKMKTEQIQGR